MPRRVKRNAPNPHPLLIILLQGGRVELNAMTHDDTPHDEETGEVRPNGRRCRITEDRVSVGRQVFAKSVLDRLKSSGLVSPENEPTAEAKELFAHQAIRAPSYRTYLHMDQAAG